MLKNEVQIEIPKATLETWQEIVDILAEIIGIPAGLIMRLSGPDIEVFVSSKSEGNPYYPGDKENFWGSGLYCETESSPSAGKFSNTWACGVLSESRARQQRLSAF